MKVHARFFLAEDARANYWHNGEYKEAAKVKMFRDATLGQEFDFLISPVQE